MGRAASAILGLTLAACGTAAQPSPTLTAPAATTTASPTPARSASAAGPWTFTVDPASKTTVRVREVLAQVRLPGDAVLAATGMKGSFTLNPDGSFAPSSKITADLSTLASDSRQRDQYIRDNTLETRRFPTAEFVPTKATGLSLPLPASGEMTFTLAGTMTIRGVTKAVAFDVKATRSGGKLAATATADPVWKFADFGMTIPRVASVLSIEDELRVAVELVATEG
jgi:polyisoprenoid-binding protein YceI